MAYTPREIKDRVAVGDDIFIIEDLGDNRVRLIPAPTHVLEVGTPVNKALLQPIEDYLATGVVPVERRIIAGSGLSGGGSLDADRTLSVKFGTTAGTVCEGNDYRLSNARPPTAHDHDDRYYTKSQFNTHMDATSVHGATSSATANRIIIRDSAGRAKVAAPSASDDIARKAEVDTHAAVQASLSQLGHVNHAVLTTTLDTSWQGSTAPYTKTQTVNGIRATDTPIVDVVMSGNFATDEARIEAWGYVYRITTADNSITLYATEKPTVSLPIQLKVVR